MICSYHEVCLSFQITDLQVVRSYLEKISRRMRVIATKLEREHAGYTLKIVVSGSYIAAQKLEQEVHIKLDELNAVFPDVKSIRLRYKRGWWSCEEFRLCGTWFNSVFSPTSDVVDLELSSDWMPKSRKFYLDEEEATLDGCRYTLPSDVLRWLAEQSWAEGYVRVYDVGGS